MKDLIKDMFLFTKKYLRSQIKGMFFTILCTISLSISPYASRYIIDDVLNFKSRSEIFVGMGIFFVVCTTMPIFTYIRNIVFMHLEQNINVDILKELFKKVLNSSITFFGKEKKGDIISRIVNDGMLASGVIKNFFVIIINNFTLIIMFVIGMCGLSIKLTLIIVTIYTIFTIINIKVGKKFSGLSMGLRKDYDSIHTSISQMIDTIETIKTFCLENDIEKKYEDNLERFRKDNVKISKLKIAISSLGDFYEAVVITIIYGLGALDVMDGKMSTGDVVALGIYFQMLKYPIEQLISANVNLHVSKPIFKRINDYMNIETEYGGKAEQLSTFDYIKIKNISYKYPEKSQDVIKDMSLVLPNKGLIAFVGESGSGKTTLAKLLLKLYIPDKGKIYIGSDDISKMGVSTLRKNIGYVSQEVIIFNDTIKNNIKCGNENISDEEMIDLCKKMNLHNKIVQLNNGYDSILSERVNLSGGEKQRLGIIRALAKNPKILILDEPTSALDSENEGSVIDELKTISKDKLVIVIEHKKNIIQCADKILRFNNGILLE